MVWPANEKALAILGQRAKFAWLNGAPPGRGAAFVSLVCRKPKRTGGTGW